MRGSIKKALLGGAAVAMIATFVPTAASADAGDTLKGPGCFFDTNANQTVDPQGNQDGVIGILAFAQDGTGAPDSESGIECWIATPTQTDTVASTDLVGTNNNGVITGEKQISYSDGANHDQNVYLCEKDSADGSSTTTCTLATSAQIPPAAVIALINTILDAVNGEVAAHVDPVICPVLGSLAPGVGPVVIDPTGDVSVVPDPTAVIFGDPGLLSPVYDCPPYIIPPPPPII